jgi:hypothetical protein
MALLEGKTPTERNKLIAAAALGVIALVALYLAFGRSLFGSSTAAKPNASPTPANKTVASSTTTNLAMPTQNEQLFEYQTQPVVYSPGSGVAPDPGRNIFAFYEPAPACKVNCPTPIPTPPPPIKPTPVPTPPILANYINPQMVYAGSRGFRLEVNGDKIPPEARIYFNQTQMPTTYINAQRVVTDIPSNLVAQEGSRQIILQTPDGKTYSNPVMMTVQAPPVPQFQYIGAILRARGNNDTAIFERQGKPGNFANRLNDVIDDRFRLVSIARLEVVLEDTQLGFRHRLPLVKGQPGTGVPPGKLGVGVPTDGTGGFVPFDPNNQSIPGIPNNVPRYVPPQPAQPSSVTAPQKKDVDDDDPNN